MAEPFQEKDPDYASLAKEASDNAVAELLAAGIPVVYLKEGSLIRHFPDHSEEVVSDEELRQVSEGALP